MANERFKKCLDIVLKHEGGFVDHPKDPGGATNFGITIKTLSEWRGRDVTVEDVRSLTKQEAAEIYLSRYWNRIRGDQLPPGVDLVVFSAAVLLGVRRASGILQSIVDAKTDGIIGQETLAKVASMDVEYVIDQFCDDWLDYLRSRPHWQEFQRGWTRRVTETKQYALEMYREFNTLREAVKTDPVKSAAATGTVLTSFSAILHEIFPIVEQVEPLLKYGYYGAMMLFVIATIVAIAWFYKGKVT